MRKGDLVTLNNDICFTTKNGGKLRYPYTHYANDDEGIFEGYRALTADERSVMAKTDYYRSMGEDGESRLVPFHLIEKVFKDAVYTVVRSRGRPIISYRNRPGMTLILDTITGNEIYINRDVLTVI